MRWTGPDGYWVSDDRSLIDVALVHEWLSSQSYWATGRSFDLVERSIAGSLALGLYGRDDDQIGFCRWVTDYATFGWLGDVFVEPRARGRGLGVFLVKTAVNHPGITDLPLQVLGTRDAHRLYGRFGFQPIAEPGRWMERRR